MAIIRFPSPIEWEDVTYSEVDTDRLDGLKGRDVQEIERSLRQRGMRDVLQPETDRRYLLAALSRATGIPEEVFGELPARTYTEIMIEAQGSLLGSGSEAKSSGEG